MKLLLVFALSTRTESLYRPIVSFIAAGAFHCNIRSEINVEAMALYSVQTSAKWLTLSIKCTGYFVKCLDLSTIELTESLVRIVFFRKNPVVHKIAQTAKSVL